MAVETIHDKIKRERNEAAPIDAGWDMVQTYRAYARGIQPQTLNADQVFLIESVLKQKFSDNIARKILDEHTDRVHISRFAVDDQRVSEMLFDLWVKNQLPDLSADLTYAVLRDGNHAVSIGWVPSDDPDNLYGGRVMLNRERWWDGKSGVFIKYDDNNQPEYAVKEWYDANKLLRQNIYYADHFQRWAFDNGEWRRYVLDGDEAFYRVDPVTGVVQRGEISWVKRDGTPLGIPIVHFANGSDDDTPYGASLLAGGVLGFQDQINAVQHDITAAAMLNGSPQTFSKGFEQPRDEDGKLIPFRSGPGAHHHAEDPQASWETIQPGDLSKLTDAYMTKLQAVCRNTNTPLHTITGQWPSGEAIYRADMPIVGATKKLVKSIGPSWSTVAHRATEIVNTFGKAPYLDEDSLIQTVFEPPEQRDPLTVWAIAEKMAPYVSNKEILRSVGKTPEEIETITEERDEEKAEAIAQAQSAFSRPIDTNTLLRAGGTAVQNKGNNQEGRDTEDEDE